MLGKIEPSHCTRPTASPKARPGQSIALLDTIQAVPEILAELLTEAEAELETVSKRVI